MGGGLHLRQHHIGLLRVVQPQRAHRLKLGQDIAERVDQSIVEFLGKLLTQTPRSADLI